MFGNASIEIRLSQLVRRVLEEIEQLLLPLELEVLELVLVFRLELSNLFEVTVYKDRHGIVEALHIQREFHLAYRLIALNVSLLGQVLELPQVVVQHLNVNLSGQVVQSLLLNGSINIDINLDKGSRREEFVVLLEKYLRLLIRVHLFRVVWHRLNIGWPEHNQVVRNELVPRRQVELLCLLLWELRSLEVARYRARYLLLPVLCAVVGILFIGFRLQRF